MTTTLRAVAWALALALGGPASAAPPSHPAGPPRAPVTRPSLVQACNHGDWRACRKVGAMYELGDGVPRSPVLAQAYYRKACATGHPAACEGP